MWAVCAKTFLIKLGPQFRFGAYIDIQEGQLPQSLIRLKIELSGNYCQLPETHSLAISLDKVQVAFKSSPCPTHNNYLMERRAGNKSGAFGAFVAFPPFQKEGGGDRQADRQTDRELTNW